MKKRKCKLLGDGIKSGMKEIACSPRELIVNLGWMDADRIERKTFELLRRVKIDDYQELAQFFQAEFGKQMDDLHR